MTKKKGSPIWVVVIIVLVVAVLGYSLYSTLQTGAAEKGVVTCVSPDNCYWTAHFHTFFPVSICGEEYRLPNEVGSLQKGHTHEEKNIAHWHDRLPYDNVNKKIVDTSDLKAGSFFDQLNIPFSQTKIDGKTNGDTCPNGTVGTWKMIVNGKASDAFREYEMHDKDVVWLVFDSRSPGELESAWKANPILFPTLGQG